MISKSIFIKLRNSIEVKYYADRQYFILPQINIQQTFRQININLAVV